MVRRHLSRVLILTGPTGSGKTGRLERWAAGRAGIAGLLQPRGPGGRRFVDLATSDIFEMEDARDGEPIVAVGRFRFRRAAFDWANERLADARAGIVLIDEIGPLELAGDGIARGLRTVIGRAPKVLILGVRDGLVGAVRDTFEIAQAEVVTVDSWVP